MKDRQDFLQIFCSGVVHYWYIWLLVWGIAAGTMFAITPPFSEIAEQGEVEFLPPEIDSRVAEKIFRDAFDKDLLRSLVVICVRRTSRPEGLTSSEEFSEQDKGRKSDFEFIENDLKPALLEILENFELEKDAVGSQVTEGKLYAAAAVTTYTDRLLGPMLISEDRQASLVIVELPNDFLDVRNAYLLSSMEKLLYENPEFRSLTPPGLEIVMSGTATVGRDMNLEAYYSAKATEKVTVIMVVVLLIIIYRAPVLAMIPLATVMMVIQLTLGSITWLAIRGIMGAFQSMDVYVIVVVYGAGVDYCLFLIARYREELEAGLSYDEAIIRSLRQTIAPLIGSAGTSIIGIGMMLLTEYQKFQQVGFGISLGLLVALIGSVTLTPALMKLCGKWAFWPNIPLEQPGVSPGWLTRSSLMQRILESRLVDDFWKQLALWLSAYPGRMWLIFTGLMFPFVIIAVLNFNNLSYGLLSELPDDSRSVVGSSAVQEHFPAGTLGPTTVLLVNNNYNFLQQDNVELVKSICEQMYDRKEELGLLDIFCSAYPLGMTPDGQIRQSDLEESLGGPPAIRAAKRAGLRARVMRQYVGNQPPAGEHVTRIDLVFTQDPFHKDSIYLLEHALAEMKQITAKVLKGPTEQYALGSTASIRDIKIVTDRDQRNVAGLVLIGVYLFLVMLLRKVAISLYLIITVFFSYLATLGVTFAVFWLLDPVNFAGIDWKVRMFLFTILIAIGEDYNIFLIARVDEEREHSNATKGVLLALMKTGSIISSCGLIMAGTFCALMAGSLVGLQQLGFALAFGVLLDTFIIRPILVPAYLILLERGTFGRYAKYLGAVQQKPAKSATET